MIDRLQESAYELSLKSHKKRDYSEYVKDIGEKTRTDKAFLRTVLKLSNFDQKNLISRVKKRAA
jgi:hypothetical protein